MTFLFLLFYYYMIDRVSLIYSSELMHMLTELGYVLTCQVKEEEKKCSFGNVLVEKSESSTRNKKWIVIVFNLNVHLHGFVLLH